MSASADDMAKTAALPTVNAGAVSATLRVEVEGVVAAATTTLPVTLIGSRRDCHLSISHPDVSKVHCVIVHTGRALLLVDLRSRAGTFVNDQPAQRVALHPGDTVRVGNVPIDVAFENWTDDLAAAAEAALLIDPPIKLDAGGHEIEVSVNGTVMGRRNTCDVVVDDTDASLAHALLFTLNDRPVLADLGSRSGTFVNAQQVALTWLNPGDRVRMGQSEFVVPGGPAVVVPQAVPAEQPVEAMATPNAATDGPLAVEPMPTPDVTSMPAVATAMAATLDADDEDLRDLDAAIAVLHGQVAAAQTALAARTEQLESEQQTLQVRAADLTRQASELDQRREELAGQEIQITQQRMEIAQQSAATVQHAAEVQRQSQELEQARQALSERTNELTAREEKLALQAASLAQREQELARREANEAQVNRKMEYFRAALKQASRAFASITEESDTTGPPMHPSQAAAADGTNDLPAPFVQQPIFQSPAAPPQRPPG
ncbi:MAG: FHA domain-containing protein [Phycisphaerae bacterium]|nr:FHA domain-containing protein [Phycisphaerae bacterium]